MTLNPPWRVLVFDDETSIFLSIEHQLSQSNRLSDFRRVHTRDDFAESSIAAHWDLLLCDYHAQDLTFPGCVEALRAQLPFTPIILIADRMGVAEAVDLLKRGIADIVLSDELPRLVSAIERSFIEATARVEECGAVKSLQEGQRLSLAALDSLSAHVAVLDSDGTILLVNRAWREFGMRNGGRGELTFEGSNYLTNCEAGGPDGQAAAATIRTVLSGVSREAVFDYPCHSPYERRWFLCRITRFRDQGPPRVVTVHVDITAQKRAEEEILHREEQLLRQRNALINLAGTERSKRGGIESAFAQITEVAAQTIGVARSSVWFLDETQSKIVCQDLYDADASEHSEGTELFAADYPAYFRALLERDVIVANNARENPLTREFTEHYFTPLGITSMMDAPIHVGGELYGVLCNEHVGAPRQWTSLENAFAIALANLVALVVEERERTRAEEQLRLHSAALGAANNGIMITERNGDILWINPAFTAMCGYSLEEAIHRNPHELLDSGMQDDALFQSLWETILAGRVWSGTLVNRRKDGSLYTESQSISPIFDDSGNITHFVSIKEDVTEKLRVDATLREARERLQRAVTAGDIALWEWELERGTVKYSAEWMGQSGAERVAKTGMIEDWLSRVHPDDIGALRQALDDCAERPGSRVQKEFRLGDGSGAYVWILMSASSEASDRGKSTRIIGANLDISDRKQLELEFQQSQKMESIGRLAGGVAHDFNNLLGVIGGYSELMLGSLDESEPMYGYVEQIRRASDRATSLTRQLLAFSRRQILRPAVADLNAIIADAESMIRRLIGEDIALTVALQPGLGHVLADTGQVDQILMNLAVNARDAMPKGGQLTITTRNETLNKVDELKRPGGRPGDYVCVVVQDTGAGMDPETQARIFEPFFTTKDQGKGTGLGLAMVYGIVKQSGGNIWVYSAPGKGAEFHIYLPRIDAPDVVHLSEELPGGLTRGTETILLAEDEEALRAVIEVTLTRAGYTVLAADDGLSAIAKMEGHSGVIHLVLTDVIMPGLSGPEIVARIRAQHPAIKVLFMSGYADDSIVHHGVLDDGIEFINKPFTFAQLNRKVREVLDK